MVMKMKKFYRYEILKALTGKSLDELVNDIGNTPDLWDWLNGKVCMKCNEYELNCTKCVGTYLMKPIELEESIIEVLGDVSHDE